MTVGLVMCGFNESHTAAIELWNSFHQKQQKVASFLCTSSAIFIQMSMQSKKQYNLTLGNSEKFEYQYSIMMCLVDIIVYVPK